MTDQDWSRSATLEDALGHGLTEKEFDLLLSALGRDLNLVELGVCAALFSEHCSYKSTKVHLRTLPVSGPRVLQGPGENAGVVDIGDGLAVAFKVESHNHPTFIEPFQGAATGVGGILRDVFTMGARPVAVMNALRFGSPTDDQQPSSESGAGFVLNGSASPHSHTKYLLSRAVAGIGTYGNCVGIPTVGGELFMHSAYSGNCLVNAFALGIVRHDQVFLGTASGVGNSILYAGSKTGRDGIHGATMASEEFSEDSEEKRPTVQVGDPFQEKLLLEACLEAMRDGAVVGIQDMGAAGMTSSTYEMAERAGTGVRIDLDLVPQREQGMNPYEIMLSESQERMLIVVEAGKEQKVIDIFNHWELDAVRIGEVTEGKEVKLYWNGECISSMPVALVTSSVPEYRWPEEKPADYEKRLDVSLDSIEKPADLSKAWNLLLSSVNVCSRRPVFQQYDSTVRANTVVHPGSDAGVIRVKSANFGVPRGKSEKGVAMSLDCNSRYCSIDPRQGAAHSVTEAYRNISAVGAVPIGISDCLNFGSPEKPQGMWEIAEAIRGLGDAARAFEVPVVSGNVSLYNETKGSPILPTPMIAMVGLIEDVSKSVGSQFRDEGDLLFVVGDTNPSEIGASEYLAVNHSLEKGALPLLNYDLEIKTAAFVRMLIEEGMAKSCHDVSSGGLAVAFAECCFGTYGAIGAEVDTSSFEGRGDGLLFSESGARYIISCSSEAAQQIEQAAQENGISLPFRGQVGGEFLSFAGIARLPVGSVYTEWLTGLSRLFD